MANRQMQVQMASAYEDVLVTDQLRDRAAQALDCLHFVGLQKTLSEQVWERDSRFKTRRLVRHGLIGGKDKVTTLTDTDAKLESCIKHMKGFCELVTDRSCQSLPVSKVNWLLGLAAQIKAFVTDSGEKDLDMNKLRFLQTALLITEQVYSNATANGDPPQPFDLGIPTDPQQVTVATQLSPTTRSLVTVSRDYSTVVVVSRLCFSTGKAF